jgi:hypothetical protein
VAGVGGARTGGFSCLSLVGILLDDPGVLTVGIRKPEAVRGVRSVTDPRASFSSMGRACSRGSAFKAGEREETLSPFLPPGDSEGVKNAGSCKDVKMDLCLTSFAFSWSDWSGTAVCAACGMMNLGAPSEV